jgi:hypothetical protein
VGGSTAGSNQVGVVDSGSRGPLSLSFGTAGTPLSSGVGLANNVNQRSTVSATSQGQEGG